MTATPIPTLQPLSIGELLDQAIRLYRKRFLTFVGILALMQIPVTVVQLLISLGNFANFDLTTPGASPNRELAVLGGCGTIAITFLTFVLVSGFATAATTRAVAENYLGETISIGAAYRKTRADWGRLLGALFVAGLLYIGLIIWLIVPCVGWLSGVGILFFYLTAIQPLLAPIVVLEKQGGGSAIRRAWDLTRRRFWWVVGFAIILTLFAQLLVTGPTTLITVVLQAIIVRSPALSQEFVSLAVLQTVVQSLASLVFTLIYIPFHLICMTLLYFNLRVRTEGFDLALLSGAATDGQVDTMQVVTQAPAPERTRLVTPTEWGNFVLLSVGAAIAVFMIWGLLAGVLGSLGMFF